MVARYVIFPKGQSPKRSFADQIGERITLPILDLIGPWILFGVIQCFGVIMSCPRTIGTMKVSEMIIGKPQDRLEGIVQ
jgi:hypothetical protein